MTWLSKMKDRVNNALERVKERIYETPEKRELERYERFVEEEETYRQFDITVTAPMERELRPFSADLRYSAKTKTHVDQKTKRFVSESDYKARLKSWRQDMAMNYMRRAHPEWGEFALVEALVRLEELRAIGGVEDWVGVEIGALFETP